MKNLLLFSFLLITSLGFTQSEALVLESLKAQVKLNSEFANPETTILTPEDFRTFKELDFYPIDEKYIVNAKFVRTPDEKPFLMPTTTARTPEYVKYGEAHFSIDGKEFVLSLFKNTQPYNEPGYEDYLF